MEPNILNKAYHNPEWTKTEESRKKLNDITGAYGMNSVALTSAEKKLIQKYAIFDSGVIDLARDTKKMLKIKPEQDIPSGRIQSGAGQTFSDLVTLEGYNKYAQYCRTAKDSLLNYDCFKSYIKSIETSLVFQRMTHDKDGLRFEPKVLNSLAGLSPSKCFESYTTVGKVVTGKQFNNRTQSFDIVKEAPRKKENDVTAVNNNQQVLKKRYHKGRYTVS